MYFILAVYCGGLPMCGLAGRKSTNLGVLRLGGLKRESRIP